MNKFIIILIAGLSIFAVVSGQQDVRKTGAAIDKGKLTLKPNSRDYAAIRMTNQHQRMELRKNRTMMLQKQLAKKRLQQMRKGRQSIQKQRKLIQQRRALRQKMLQQQRRRNQRR